jgi:urease accessory protein
VLHLIENLGVTPDEASDSLTLPFDSRRLGRLRATTDGGQEVGLFLERGKVLQEGDRLRSKCGKIIMVKAQAEDVVTASCDNWLAFARACYHLGNRHVPLQIGERWLRFKPDSVLEELVDKLGLTVKAEQVPFNPEGGAYAQNHHSH